MKKLKKEKLDFEKFTVAELSSLNKKTIKGGLDNTDVPTLTVTDSKGCISSLAC